MKVLRERQSKIRLYIGECYSCKGVLELNETDMKDLFFIKADAFHTFCDCPLCDMGTGMRIYTKGSEEAIKIVESLNA